MFAHTFTGAFLAAGGNDKDAARAYHRDGGKEQIRRRAAGLIDVGILRKAHPADGDIKLMRNGHLVNGFGKPHQLLERQQRIAGGHAQNAVFIIQHHVEDKAQTGPARGFVDRLAEGIALNASQPCGRVVDKGRPVGVSDQRFAGRSHRHRFAAARVPGVLMRLHNAGGDQQIRLHSRPMGGYRYPAGGNAQIHQCRGVLRLVIDHTVPGGDVSAQLGDLFSRGRGAVHADAAQQGDILIMHAGLFQFR